VLGELVGYRLAVSLLTGGLIQTTIESENMMTVTEALRRLPEPLREQVEYRELLVRRTARDLTIRYKQTVMGFGWAVFMPLVNTIVFSTIFSRVANIHTPVPYPLFAYCGFLVWNFFASSLRFSVTSLTSNSNLVTKIYFPREIFPFSAVLVSLVDMAVGATVLVGMMIWYGVAPGASLVALPLVILVHVSLTAAVGLFLSMANLFYRDVKYVFEVAIMIWMFATSVLYPVTGIGGKLGVVLLLNPMTHVLDAYRATLFYGQWPAAPFAATAVVSAAALAAAWALFHAAEFRFAESI